MRQPQRASRLPVAFGLAQAPLFGAAIVLSRYTTVPTTPDTLVRPLLVVIGVSTVIALAFWLVSRRVWWSSIAASATVLLSMREPIVGGILAAFAIWWLLLAAGRRLHRRPMPSTVLRRVGLACGVVSVMLVGVTAAGVVVTETSRPSAVGVVDFAASPRVDAGGTDRPNIYLILLDGYPRADTLADVFGIDNRDFSEALESRGFALSERARANYPSTWLTLTSMLNGSYVGEMLANTSAPDDRAGQIRWLQSRINDSAAVSFLRQQGYELISIPSPIRSAGLMAADRYLADDGLTDFEAHLLGESLWSLLFRDEVVELIHRSHATHVRHALDATTAISREASGPRFVLTHVLSPHPPFALATDRAAAPRCFPLTCNAYVGTKEEMEISLTDYAGLLAPQLNALNGAVLQTLDEMVLADPGAVIVVMSDHGARYSVEDPAEEYRTLLAARTPGRSAVFSEDISPVNVLRALFQTYFGAATDPLPYEAWRPEDVLLLKLRPFDELE